MGGGETVKQSGPWTGLGRNVNAQNKERETVNCEAI